MNQPIYPLGFSFIHVIIIFNDVIDKNYFIKYFPFVKYFLSPGIIVYTITCKVYLVWSLDNSLDI